MMGAEAAAGTIDGAGYPSSGTLRGLLEPGAVLSARQPIVRLDDGAVVGYEALARIPDGGVGAIEWLAHATAVGLREAMEISFLRAAVADGLPPEGRLLFEHALRRADRQLYEAKHRQDRQARA